MPQNFNAYTQVTGIQGFQQLIAQGPVASQEAIKMLGTNGGGFFNANSAHPFENPTPFSNLIEMLSIFSIGAGLIYLFGKMANDTQAGLDPLLRCQPPLPGSAPLSRWAQSRRAIHN